MKRKKLKGLSLQDKQSIMGYVFISPFLIGFVLVFLVALKQSLTFSFSSLEMTKEGVVSTGIGFENFHKALMINPQFRQILVQSLSDTAANVPIIIIFSFFMSNVLNQKFWGRTFARSIFFLPVILVTGIVARAEATDMLFNILKTGEGADTGVTSGMFRIYELTYYLLQTTRLTPEMIDYLLGAIERIYDVVVNSGVQILIFLAGLQSISPSLFEAAYVEGATGWESFWKITLPMISPLILVNTVYTVIDSFTNPNNPVMHTIQQTAFVGSDYGYASAMAWIYFLIILVVLLIVGGIISSKVFYQE